MIDIIYQTILTLLSKDNQGYVTPTEFDRVANLVQNQIYREYFEDENRDKVKGNRGGVVKGYSNLPFNVRQRIDRFAESTTLTFDTGRYQLPADLYMLEDDGLYVESTGRLVSEVERRDLAVLLNNPLARPTEVHPVYEMFSDNIKVYPTTLQEDIGCRYLRKPRQPRWTYFMLPNNQPMFDPTNPSYQDFDLHTSEFPNILLKMLPHFGLAIREQEVIEIAERLKQELNQNDNM